MVDRRQTDCWPACFAQIHASPTHPYAENRLHERSCGENAEFGLEIRPADDYTPPPFVGRDPRRDGTQSFTRRAANL
jgi:hypothetical protein